MKRPSDRFAEAAEGCADLSRLRTLLGEAALELGFDYFALLDHSSLVDPGPGLVRIDNYPGQWVEELLARGYAPDDPVHQASRRTNAGFRWSDLGALVRLNGRHREILERSRYHGIGAGFTIPANRAGRPSASCSFAVRRGGRLPVRRLDCAELIGIHALRAARRLQEPTRTGRRPRLSRRQVQCLKLVARGKTDWEIAHVLGLSIHTAHQYVKAARAAYDTISRTQLVVYGLRDSWISFEDAIPPNG